MVILPEPDLGAENYNIGEHPLAGGEVTAGQTATIGFLAEQERTGLDQVANVSALSFFISLKQRGLYRINGYKPRVNTNLQYQLCNLGCWFRFKVPVDIDEYHRNT